MELMVALAILSLSMGAALVLGLGQTSGSDSESAREALLAARAVVEELRQKGESDFRTLHATSSSYTFGSTTYSVVAEVTQENFFTKTVQAVVLWGATFGRTLSIDIPFIVTDKDHAVGGNTCYSEVDTALWKSPTIKNTEKEFAKLVFDHSGVYTLAAVDAYKDVLYVGVGSTGEKADPTVFILNPETKNPAFLGAVDTSTSTVSGVAAIRVAEDVATNKRYAYVANNYTANFSTCSQYYNCAQLQIIDVTNPQSVALSSVRNYKVPGVTGSQGAGKSLAYDRGYVYLGLSGTGNKGPEFHVVDVRVPEQPQFVGSYAVGSGVGAIYVRGSYAYLATDNLSKEVLVLDISDKTNPRLVGSYNAMSDVTNFGYGKALDVVGDTLYLGRTFISNAPELQLIHISQPSIIPPPPIGTRDVGPNSANPFSLNGILVRDTLLFAALGSGTKGGSFQIFSIKNPSAIQSHAVVSLPSGGNGTGAQALDCEGNTFYVVSNDVNKKGYLSVITTP